MQEVNKRLRINLTSLQAFISQFHGKFKRHLKSRFEKTTETKGVNGQMFKLKDAQFNLEKQMQAWRKNPVWEDDQPPSIEVVVPKGSLCQLNAITNVGLPPDAIYNIVTDPSYRKVFKTMQEVVSRKVLLDEGSRQIVELEQAAVWRFFWWSGTFPLHVLVDQNREDYSIKFKQVKSGFMKRFEGSWTLEPILVDEKLCHPFKPKTLSEYMSYTQGNGRIASKVTLQQLVEPAIVPPPPISWYLRGITTKTVEMLINDLVEEAARVKCASADDLVTTNPNVNEALCNETQTLDIKERWSSRRRKSRRNILKGIKVDQVV
ncbi:hypothetical protein QVD17_21231 [Tagetes erecta]|uniref:DUF220 domain-containing protein n=1 Tax=Tagetes erecta TaxID=13708 RepID=A0AAD8NYS9_TARER|nr:hypothetical protein QVD17_21231 [Tagetes erecta]